MIFQTLNKRPGMHGNPRSERTLAVFNRLFEELKKHDIPTNIISAVDNEIKSLNDFQGTDREWLKNLRKGRSRILKLLDKELKLVPKNHYRNMWMALGMSVFGVPLGVIFGASLDNMGLMGIGIPMGMAIGLGIGTSMDQKAKSEGRQLDIEIS